MFIYNVSGKKIIRVLLIIFAVVMVLGLTFCVFNNKPGKSAADVYIYSSKDQDSRQEKVEVFDISQGKVIREFNTSPVLRSEAVGFLKKMTSVYVKVKAIPSVGKIVKIPLNPAVRVRSRLFNGDVQEVFILFPEGGQPYLMVLDEKNRPLFFNFKGDTSKLTELVGLDRKNELPELPEPVNYTPESRL